MARSLIELKIVCQNNKCRNSNSIRASTLNEHLGDEPNLINVGNIATKFICSVCKSKDYLIFDDNDELIFDTSALSLCHGSFCDEAAIPIPRLNASPHEKLCIICKQNSENEKLIKNDFPDVPKNKRSCPRCLDRDKKDTPVVVYKNRKNETFFIGCSLFPKCRWAEEL